MANRYPLIVNNLTGSIEELPAGDNLDLTSSGIVNAGAVVATSFSGNGANLTNINGANVSTVSTATTAGTVTTAAQPNITSTGTMVSLTVNGTTNLGDVANVKISGGTANYVLKTDGSGNLSWAAQTGGGGSAGLQDIFLLGGM